MSVQRVKIVENILAGNDQIAARNQVQFAAAGVLVVNIMASPGAGKTSTIVRTIEGLHDQLAIGVIEGDIAGSIDTETVLRAGARDAVQINTGGSCHLEANMIQRAVETLDLEALDLLFVENVGNLVCPTHWALGEAVRLCVSSTAEGHDKPIKYPELFTVCDVILLNKIDLMAHVDFDRAFFYDAVRALNPAVPIFEISCRTGEGLPQWFAWLHQEQQKAFGPVPAH